ncbi:MAG: DUF4347 domain-containing protein [Leptolyngbyaceae cyanobacterium]
MAFISYLPTNNLSVGLAPAVPSASQFRGLSPGQVTKLVVIDSGVEGYKELVSGLLPDQDLAILHPAADGIEQISYFLSQGNYTDLAIVAHGEPGKVYLGNSILQATTLSRYTALLSGWGVDQIDLWSCQVAQNSLFVAQLAEITKAKVFASHEQIGQGNWSIVGAEVPFYPDTQNDWRGLLNQASTLTADVVDVTPDPRSTAVNSIIINFSEVIDSTSFSVNDLTLKLGNSTTNLLAGSSATISQINSTSFSLNGLAGLTGNQGIYQLLVHTPGITTATGTPGFVDASDYWEVTAPGPIATTDGYLNFIQFTRAARFTGAPIPFTPVEVNGLQIPLLFDETYYTWKNPDVQAAVQAGQFRSGYEHFVYFGQFEGRSPSTLYNEQYYLSSNPDVDAAVKSGQLRSGLQHFLLYGNQEGRNPSALFNQKDYLTGNLDVQAAIGSEFTSAFDHFIEYGVNEGRVPNLLLFQEAFYLNQNPDVKAAVQSKSFASGYQHYLQFGAREGRDPSLLFNEQAYRSLNPDVAAAIANGTILSGFTHYILFGRAEGRQTVSKSPASSQNILNGNAGDSSIYGGSNPSTTLSSDSKDPLYGSGGQEIRNGGAGDDLIYGDADTETLLGGDGKDTLYGNGGRDILNGGAGDDLIYGDAGADTLLGGDGNDTLYGNGGRDILNGGAGDDLIYGGSDADIIFGGDGNDTIYGNGGGDLIDGGAGSDTIWLGSGAATVVLSSGDGYDTINNFQLGATKFKVDTLNNLNFVDSSDGARISQGSDLLAIVSWQSANTFSANLNQIFIT